MSGESLRKARRRVISRSEVHTSELQSLRHLVCRLLLEKKKQRKTTAAERRMQGRQLLSGENAGKIKTQAESGAYFARTLGFGATAVSDVAGWVRSPKTT